MTNFKQFFLLATLLAVTTQADQESSPKAVSSVGSQKNGAAAYFRVEGNWSTNCKFNVMYFESNTAFGKSALSIILTAKSTGKKLSRIDYIQRNDDTCHLTLVEI